MPDTSKPRESPDIIGVVKDRSDLSDLYPAPKTYEQIKQGEALLQKSYRRRLPKRPHVTIAGYGAIVFAGIVVFAQNITNWWTPELGENKAITVSLVFFSFALLIVLAALFVVWVNYTMKLFSHFEGATKPFWLIYGVSVAILLTVWLNGWVSAYTDTVWLLVLPVIYFFVVLIGARNVVAEEEK